MPKHHHVSIKLSSNGPRQICQMSLIVDFCVQVDPFRSIFFRVDDSAVLTWDRFSPARTEGRKFHSLAVHARV